MKVIQAASRFFIEPSRFEIKSVKANQTGALTLSGHASVFDVIDSYGEVVRRGAFRKTLQERVPKGLVKLLIDHDWYRSVSVMGTVVRGEEDQVGLDFDAELTVARDIEPVLTRVREGHVTGLSIGYYAVRTSPPEEGNTEVFQYLDEVKLMEISVVAFPANEEARIEALKSRFDETVNEKALPVIDAPNWDETAARVALAEYAEANAMQRRRVGLAFAGPFVIGDVIDGELALIKSALDKAREDLLYSIYRVGRNVKIAGPVSTTHDQPLQPRTDYVSRKLEELSAMTKELETKGVIF